LLRCEECGEPVLETHLVLRNGRRLCLDCLSGMLPACMTPWGD